MLKRIIKGAAITIGTIYIVSTTGLSLAYVQHLDSITKYPPKDRDDQLKLMKAVARWDLHKAFERMKNG